MNNLIVKFTASLPPIQSAININGIGDGARIKLDIPASDIEQVIKLQKMTGKSFKVIIECEKKNEFGL